MAKDEPARAGRAGGSDGATPSYAPIRDYAAIGDCHGAALVGRSGSIDWCALGRIDADPVFCRLLDAERGGFLSVCPTGRFSASRGYLDGTNILRTTFATEGGRVTLTDFMPVGRRPGSGTHDYVHLNAPASLVRIVEGVEGRVPVRIRYRPSIDFAKRPVTLRGTTGHLAAEAGPSLYHDLPGLALEGERASAAVTLEAGARHTLVLTPQAMRTSPIGRTERLLAVTEAFWREWIAYCRYRGPYEAAVRRSALALKLLTYAPSGAIAAALTTSLPEEIGGDRNWDYRYCWLRDAAFTLYGLAALGYGGEARRFSAFLPRVYATTHPELRIMYGIGAEPDLAERTLDHLEGYRGSRPVRTGNGAYRQRQIDVYGEVLDWGVLFHTLGGRFDHRARRMLTTIAEFVAAHWREPDHGLWEMRGPPRHHVHGKIMSWVALDRAIRLLGSRPDWVEERRRIVEDVHAHGIAEPGGYLLQAYDHGGTDAALLLASLVGFPAAPETLRATVEAVERELRHGDFVYRYKNDDGLEGNEGAFLICSFWLVDALLHQDRGVEAKALFERLLARANDVGLYAEEADPASGAFLGNFPQAFTHLALIGAAVHLDLYDRGGPAALAGSYADRARHEVGATLGWRALWAAFKMTRRVGRLLPSRRSILAKDRTA